MDPKAYHLDHIDLLAPVLRKPAREFHDRARLAGIHLLIHFSYRTGAEQWELFKKGRAQDPTSKIWTVADKALVVTNARPWETPHCLIDAAGRPASLAFDCVPLDANGRALWNTADLVWARLWELAAKCGLDPLGDAWGSFLAWDKGHFEEPGWKLKLESLGLRFPDLAVAA